jgi:diguanylate cyclase (GGDEF)-like protein
MQDSIRGIDVLCRWGGEEFAVLLPNAGPEATLLVAERMRQNIRMVNSSSERFANRVPTDFQLTASVGAANFGYGADNVEAMLQRADSALYEAKNAGRDRVVLAGRNGSPAGECVGVRAGLGQASLLEAT